MLEPVRSRYLAALGLDAYVPRVILPGARASAPCEWQAPAVAESPIVAVEADAAPVKISRVLESVAVTARASSPALTPSKTAALRSASAAAPSAPKFALSVVVAGNGVLLIDDAPATGAQRNEYRRLLEGFLKAVNNDAQFSLDVFSWPLRNGPPIAQDEQAARETLTAYLHRQIHQHALKTVLLLGAAAQQWVDLDAAELRCIRSNSLLGCLSDASLKRQLWNDVRELSGR